MTHLHKTSTLTYVPLAAFLFFAVSTKAQKYKTISDTLKLNKKYAEINLEVEKLNARLAVEKGKTANYEAKTILTANEASEAVQNSKDQANMATDGDTKDTKKAVKEAKKANKEANNAKLSKEELRKNEKRIGDLQNEIAKKQTKLVELDGQRAALNAKQNASQNSMP